MFVQVTFVPVFTVRVAGLKAKFIIVTLFPLLVGVVVDAVVEPEDLRSELVRRFALAADKRREWPRKRNPVTPV